MKINTTIVVGLVCVANTLFTSHADAAISLDTECNIQVNGHVSLKNNDLLITTEQNQNILINAQHDLFVNDQAISLNAEQKTWVGNYYSDIQRSIPMVVEVAIEGINIANYAVSEALGGILGKDSNTVRMLSDKLNEIEQKLHLHIHQNPQHITFDTQTLEQELGMGNKLDAEVDRLVEEAMQSAMGEFFMLLGKSMLSGGNANLADFEQRMQNIGNEIESKIESQTTALEVKAEELCTMLNQVDQSQTQLHSIPALQHLNVVSVNRKI